MARSESHQEGYNVFNVATKVGLITAAIGLLIPGLIVPGLLVAGGGYFGEKLTKKKE